MAILLLYVRYCPSRCNSNMSLTTPRVQAHGFQVIVLLSIFTTWNLFVRNYLKQRGFTTINVRKCSLKLKDVQVKNQVSKPSDALKTACTGFSIKRDKNSVHQLYEKHKLGTRRLPGINFTDQSQRKCSLNILLIVLFCL